MASVVETQDESNVKMIPEYVLNITGVVPTTFFEVTGCILVASLVLILFCKDVKKGFRLVFLIALIEYITLIYSSTVFCRLSLPERKYDFHPFWTYNAIMDGENLYIGEILMNIVMFIPVGLLLGFAIKGLKWWQVLLIGGGISFSIEILQFVLMRGFSEIDDIMHNTLGCMIGYGIYSLVRVGYESISERRLGVL